MSSPTYYSRRGWDSKVCIYKRVKAGGDRCMAQGMSDKFAAYLVRLLNEAEAHDENVPLSHLSLVPGQQQLSEEQTPDT